MKDSRFRDGTIEVDLAGQPGAGALPDARGFTVVNGAAQPCLVVTDLKLEPAEGRVALWVGPGTEGYFSNLKIAAK